MAKTVKKRNKTNVKLETKHDEAAGLNSALLSCDSFTGIVRPTLFQVIGDNLGIHELLGFSGSFSANFTCRFCKTPKEITKQQLVEDISSLRCEDNYDQDLAMNDLSKSGIKRASQLNKLDDFHVCQNYAVDVMHDFLEGVIPLEFKLVIGCLIEQGCFSLQEINDRLSSFNYGLEDKNNKPSPISPSALTNPTGASGQRAAQMKCLAFYLPLNISDLVDENFDVLEVFFLLLMGIYKIVMAPSAKRVHTF